MEYNLYKDIENEICDAINKIVDDFLQGKTLSTRTSKNIISRDDYDKYFSNTSKTVKDLKSFRLPKNFKGLIEDIKHVGLSSLKNSQNPDLEYESLVRKVLDDVIKDRTALMLDSDKIIKTFENFSI
jgi:hypothetical protein